MTKHMLAESSLEGVIEALRGARRLSTIELSELPPETVLRLFREFIEGY